MDEPRKTATEVGLIGLMNLRCLDSDMARYEAQKGILAISRATECTNKATAGKILMEAHRAIWALEDMLSQKEEVTND